MPSRTFASAILGISMIAFVGAAHSANSAQQKKDYLSEFEADKIRDAVAPGDRIKLFVSFAADRLKKFQYELTRETPDRRRNEILNGLLNGYSGCIDDAADQIDVAREKQADIHGALKLLQARAKDFLGELEKVDRNAADFETYKDTLDDAIEGTKDALADAQQAEKETSQAPVRRKPG